jgi:hypothetical protein
VDGVLDSGLSAAVVEVVVHPLRDREIGLLDPPPHLLKKQLLQVFRVLHDCPGVSVLGIQVVENLRIISIPEPEIIINPSLAVDDVHPRLNPSHRRKMRRRRGGRERFELRIMERADGRSDGDGSTWVGRHRDPDTAFMSDHLRRVLARIRTGLVGKSREC